MARVDEIPVEFPTDNDPRNEISKVQGLDGSHPALRWLSTTEGQGGSAVLVDLADPSVEGLHLNR